MKSERLSKAKQELYLILVMAVLEEVPFWSPIAYIASLSVFMYLLEQKKKRNEGPKNTTGGTTALSGGRKG